MIPSDGLGLVQVIVVGCAVLVALAWLLQRWHEGDSVERYERRERDRRLKRELRRYE